MDDAKQITELTAAALALAGDIEGWLNSSRDEVRANLGKFGLDAIPAADGGHLLADEVAMTTFRAAFVAAFDTTPYRLRVSSTDAYREFKKGFSERLLYGGEQINRKTVLKQLRNAIATCAEKIKPIKRYIACNICHSDQPLEIDFGLVRFIPAATAMKILDEALEKAPQLLESLEEEHGWAGAPQRRLDTLKGHYAAFDWVAEVSISEFDGERGIEQSYRLAQCGLDFLHLLIGAPYSDRMRLDWNLLDSDRPSSFAISHDGSPLTRINYRSTSRHLGDAWWDEVRNNVGKDGVELFQLVLDRANDAVNTHPLARRYVDALTWYGDAVREKTPVSRLLKFVMAIEFLIGTADTVEISKTLSRRGASILFMRNYGDLHDLNKRFLKIYDARSAIVHGSISPRDAAIGSVLAAAEELSRSLLIEMLPILGRRGFEERAVSIKRIKRFYEGIARKAAERHGMPISV